jgi:hypothetical protein
MLAFSAVTQFPINGSSTRADGGGAQASTSAEDVMTVERHKIRIASPRRGTTCIASYGRTSAEPGCRARMRVAFVSPSFSEARID